MPVPASVPVATATATDADTDTVTADSKGADRVAHEIRKHGLARASVFADAAAARASALADALDLGISLQVGRFPTAQVVRRGRTTEHFIPHHARLACTPPLPPTHDAGGARTGSQAHGYGSQGVGRERHRGW